MATTNAPLSEVAIANFAATTLDDQALTTLDDNNKLGRFMARNFGFVRDELLRGFPWTFAKKRALMTALADAPAFGFRYQYQAPADCLRVLPLTDTGEEDGEEIRHKVEGDLILTDVGPSLRIRYIRKGIPAAKFDPLFARALGQLLAVYAAQNITGKASYVDKAIQLFDRATSAAYLVSSLESGSVNYTAGNMRGANAMNVRGIGL